jgi:hypothetical protein
VAGTKPNKEAEQQQTFPSQVDWKASSTWCTSVLASGTICQQRWPIGTTVQHQRHPFLLACFLLQQIVSIKRAIKWRNNLAFTFSIDCGAALLKSAVSSSVTQNSNSNENTCLARAQFTTSHQTLPSLVVGLQCFLLWAAAAPMHDPTGVIC